MSNAIIRPVSDSYTNPGRDAFVRSPGPLRAETGTEGITLVLRLPPPTPAPVITQRKAGWTPPANIPRRR